MAGAYNVSSEKVLELACDSGCTAYDCEYVALAQELGVPLVTTDKQVLRAFPKTAVSLEKFAKKKMSRKLNITVMLGGPSAEREVSLRSGAAVAQGAAFARSKVFEIDPKTPDWILPPETDVVFLALHGTYGEDGTVQSNWKTRRALHRLRRGGEPHRVRQGADETTVHRGRRADGEICGR